MLRRTPPLSAIEAFLAAVHAPSFRAAAEDLALSPSAFSRRIQMLERFVDAPLFDRSGPSATLTENGRRYREAIEPAVRVIRDATMQLRRDRAEPLRISASQTFAVEWLMPRLAALHEQCDVAVDLVVCMGIQPLRAGEADLAIVGGVEAPAEFDSDEILAGEGTPVCAPRLASGRPRPSSLAELEAHDLLDLRHPQRMWHRWLEAVGHADFEPRITARFDCGHVMYEAVANGLGVGLATPLTSERHLRERRFTPCTAHMGPIGASYRLLYRTPEAARRPETVRFRDWLAAEVDLSLQLFRGYAAGAAAQ